MPGWTLSLSWMRGLSCRAEVIGFAQPVSASFANARVTDVRGRRVKSIDVRTSDGGRKTLSADLLAVSGGWNPAIGLGSNLGARPDWSDQLQTFILNALPPGVSLAGAANGHFALAAALLDGVRAAADVIRAEGLENAAVALPSVSEDPAASEPLWHVGAHRKKAFVDLQHDVTDADVKLAATGRLCLGRTS